MKTEMHKLFRSGCALSLAIALCFLAACQSMTPQEKQAANQRTCLGYGFLPESAAMERCLNNLQLPK